MLYLKYGLLAQAAKLLRDLHEKKEIEGRVSGKLGIRPKKKKKTY